jgi:hypothetical protein
MLKGGFVMAKKRYGPEQIINKLREVEVMLSKGSTCISLLTLVVVQ